MTDERDKLDDESVSATYRAIARERAPQYLNDRVLRMAANPANSASRVELLLNAWTKPFAWVAVISLCVVIGLEWTELAEHDARSTATTDSVRERFVPRDLQTIQDARDRARLQDGPNNEPVLSTDVDQPVSAAALAHSCEAQDRISADVWFDCIRDLRQANRAVDADREYASFILEYPNFPKPY